jgi:hypothetical protein
MFDADAHEPQQYEDDGMPFFRHFHLILIDDVHNSMQC